MNAIAMLYADQALRLANERAAALRREAELNRIVAARPRRSILTTLGAALTSLRTAVQTVDADLGPGLPTLREYPNRG
jgi:hypothetical protein